MESFSTSPSNTVERSVRARSLSLSTRLDWPFVVTGVGLWLIFAGLLATIQIASPNLPGNDDYFHIKIAQIMREEGIRPHFPWLPLTILNDEEFFDHHFFYHVLLIPFTYGDLREGAKWVGIIFPAWTFLVGWFVLHGQRVPYAALWALGFFAVSEAFLNRLVMTRVQAVSLLMLILMLHVALKGRYRWLLPLAFIYTWLYDAFPLLLIMIGIYVATRWLFDQRLNLAPLIYTGLGVGLGLVINPYFPNNIIFIYHHIWPKLFDDSDIRVGNEWYPYETWTLVENSGLALLIFFAGTFALGFRDRRMNPTTGVLFLVALFFGLLLFRSRRFVEYFPAFALLFGAVAWQPLLAEWRQKSRIFAKIMPALLMLVLIPAIWLNIREAREDLADSSSYLRYAQASAWLVENSPPNSRVFNTDWDDFTRLFFYNTHNIYMLGLDPTYMHQYDPELYQLWRSITRGEVPDSAKTIRQVFGAEYVLTDLGHHRF
nr:hypothetical protein [Anaerolineae bacterium]